MNRVLVVFLVLVLSVTISLAQVATVNDLFSSSDELNNDLQMVVWSDDSGEGIFSNSFIAVKSSTTPSLESITLSQLLFLPIYLGEMTNYGPASHTLSYGSKEGEVVLFRALSPEISVSSNVIKVIAADYSSIGYYPVRFHLVTDVSYLSSDGIFADVNATEIIGARVEYENPSCDFSVIVHSEIAKFTSTGIEDASTEPKTSKLMQNYPNPFNPSTTINYYLEKSGNVNLSVYNTAGQLVETLVNETQAVGTYNVQFNAGNLPSGIYFYSLTVGNNTEISKMNLVK